MRLSYLEICGFRGYRKTLRIEFADGHTIIDGRNGCGKSTIFDAVEFALTGTIAKYGDAKADRETIADYIWWTGQRSAPAEHYVELGFRDGSEELSVRRTRLSDADPKALDIILDRLCDRSVAQKSPLAQLCASSIIRDEHIAAFSLDLKEAERYALLYNAIGASDADALCDRAAGIAAIVRRRTQALEKEVEAANQEISSAARRLDEIRAMLVEETALAEATARLQAITDNAVAADQLAGPAREAIAERSRQLEELISLERAWIGAAAERDRLVKLDAAFADALAAKMRADIVLADLAGNDVPIDNSEKLSLQARNLSSLVVMGRALGLHEGHCPLCASKRTDAEFQQGLRFAEDLAKELDNKAVEQVERERARSAAQAEAVRAARALEQYEADLQTTKGRIHEFARRLSLVGLTDENNLEALRGRQESLRMELELLREDLRIIETLQLNASLERAVRAESDAKKLYERAEERLGRARRSESRAQALHDAARRAAGETLNRRLERVLPLMAELYRRLRPHPVWNDIEYKVRGDVRRFLRLQVGDELNPQFMFSSGQRRATGLAFLLSVNLSLTWSRWQSIMLDDPVQHIDDFRSIHLAEVMAQLAGSGRQIVCAIEDAALADLLCRRLPIERPGQAKRITLGPDLDGDLAVLKESELPTMLSHALVPAIDRLTG